LGHFVLGHDRSVDKDVYRPGDDPLEKAANSFAASFLVPRRDLQARAGGDLSSGRVLELATEFGVSYPTLVYRLHNCGLLAGGASQRDGLLAERSAVIAEQLQGGRLSGETQWPPEYTEDAVAAFQRGLIDLDRLAELLEREPAWVRRQLEASDAGEG
jgi:Zn-dependent peptidase ImmA (M78 family)